MYQAKIRHESSCTEESLREGTELTYSHLSSFKKCPRVWKIAACQESIFCFISVQWLISSPSCSAADCAAVTAQKEQKKGTLSRVVLQM